MMRKTGYLIVSAMLMAAIMHCSMEYAGIETTNGATVVASASSISGIAPLRSLVSVCDSAYIPLVDSGNAWTSGVDNFGNFEFNNLAQGTYTIVVKTENNDSGTVFKDVQVGKTGAADTVHGIVKPTGSIRGTISTVSNSNPEILIFLSGTGYYQVLPQPGPFEFISVPPGTYELQACALFKTDSGGGIKPVIFSESGRQILEVKSGLRSVGVNLDLP